MIQKISEIFKQDSEVIRFLKKSSLSRDNQVYNQEEIEFLIQYMIKERNLRDFFDFYSRFEMQTYNIKMKMLIITHQQVHLNEEFSKIFTTLKLPNFFLLKHTHRNYETWLLLNIQIPFLSYLQKLAISFKDIKSYKTCIFRKSNNQNLVIDSFKMVNIVNMALFLVPNLKTALINYPQDLLLQILTFRLYQEIQGYQKYLINSMMSIFNKNSQTQNVEVYELLREIKTIEQKMILFHQFRNLYDSQEITNYPYKIKINIENFNKSQQSEKDCRIQTKREYLQSSSRTRQSTAGEAITPKSQKSYNYFDHHYSSCAQLLIKDYQKVIQEESETQIDQTLQP